jgi:hypothetical protein
MKLYKVYHNSDFMEHSGWSWGEKVMPQMEKLALVAMVNCATLEDAFRCTNHIDRNWMENPNVFPTDMKARSTSCGDVVEDPDGHKWVVAAYGFKAMI